jgi:hypothetical protein
VFALDVKGHSRVFLRKKRKKHTDQRGRAVRVPGEQLTSSFPKGSGVSNPRSR